MDPEQFKMFGKLVKPFVDSLGTTMLRYFTLLEKTESLIDAAKESEDLLYVDRLTGLFNQRYFIPRLTSEIARAERYKHPISLILMEADDLDENVAEVGHLARDMILIEVGNIVEKGARKAEVVVRLDEAKFAIILPEADHEKAYKVAERLRKIMALKKFGEEAGLAVDLKMSFGIGSLLKNITTEKLRQEAEEMLTKAQDEGGNRIRVSPIPETEPKPPRKKPYIASLNGNGKPRRVVITGIGVITPIGIGKDAFWKGIQKGQCGIDHIQSFDTSDSLAKIGGEIRDFIAEDHLNPKEARRMDRFTQFAVAASRLAIKDANLSVEKLNRDKVGVITGTAMGGLAFAAKEHEKFLAHGRKKINPFLPLALTWGASSGQVSIDLGVTGPSTTFSNGCNSGTDAISYAFDLVSRGDIDVAISGGTDAPLTPLVVDAFAMLGALSTRNGDPKSASRPFDLKRDGFVMGEGACILILEELEHALRRNACIYAEILSYGLTCDSYHMTRPEPNAKESSRAIEMALEKASIHTSDVQYINAHGSSTPLNDAIETKAIKKVFGSHAQNIAVSSTKSMIGHSIGAPGAIELAVTALAVDQDYLPPTINYEYPDPDCDLDYVPNTGRSQNVEVAISNSFSFGGKNTVIVLSKCRDEVD
jgi:3-oxoacyl-[acyl-carrier-protein] synthase II